MSNLRTTVLAACSALIFCQAANAAVTVEFIEPDKFIDVPRMESDRNQMMAELKAHLVKLGEKLPPGQDLKVEILEIDLAGRLEPRPNGGDIRVLRGGADWPRIKLRYQLSAGGKVIKSGEDDAAQMDYLNRANHYRNDQSLRHEKILLDEWFKKTFVAKK